MLEPSMLLSSHAKTALDILTYLESSYTPICNMHFQALLQKKPELSVVKDEKKCIPSNI